MYLMLTASHLKWTLLQVALYAKKIIYWIKTQTALARKLFIRILHVLTEAALIISNAIFVVVDIISKAVILIAFKFQSHN